MDVWLIRQKTPDVLREEIPYHISQWKLNLPSQFDSNQTSPIQAQTRIGWTHFLDGRPVKAFETYMEESYKKWNIKKSGRTWLTTLVQKIWTILHRQQWENRNTL